MTHLLYVSRSAGPHDARFIDAWRDAGFEVSSLALTEDVDSGNLKLGTELAEAKPDIVQVGPLTLPGAQVAEIWSGPLIATSWGFDLQREAAASPEARNQVQQTLCRADLLFVDNDVTAGIAIRAGVPRDAVIQFPWGVDPHWLDSPMLLRPPQSAPVYLCVRSHERLYHVDDVIRAFHATRARRRGAQLWLAGGGRETRALQALSQGLGLDEHVRWLGTLSGSDLREAYGAADVYVSASETDGSSVSLLEAMASNTPAVVSDIQGNRQWIDATTGWMFAFGDVDALTATLDRFGAPSDEVWVDVQGRVATARSRVMSAASWAQNRRKFPEYADMAVERARYRLGRE